MTNLDLRNQLIRIINVNHNTPDWELEIEALLHKIIREIERLDARIDQCKAV